MICAPIVVGENVSIAELPIELAARRIVDRGDDLRDAEHLLGDERGHHVAVVAVGHGDEAVGALGTRALEHVVVDAGADFDLAGEAIAQPFERGRVLVHDDDVVLVGDEQLGEGRPHAPAADDQVSHGALRGFGTACIVPARGRSRPGSENPGVLAPKRYGA